MKATDNFINQAGERAAQIAPKITLPDSADQILWGKGPRNGQYVGAVAICQALRRLGCSYSQISSIVGSSDRTVWNHVHAMSGSNVAPWGRRSLEARSRAMQLAAILIAECHMTPRGQ
jgi:hypothetical protein